MANVIKEHVRDLNPATSLLLVTLGSAFGSLTCIWNILEEEGVTELPFLVRFCFQGSMWAFQLLGAFKVQSFDFLAAHSFSPGEALQSEMVILRGELASMPGLFASWMTRKAGSTSQAIDRLLEAALACLIEVTETINSEILCLLRDAVASVRPAVVDALNLAAVNVLMRSRLAGTGSTLDVVHMDVGPPESEAPEASET